MEVISITWKCDFIVRSILALCRASILYDGIYLLLYLLNKSVFAIFLALNTIVAVKEVIGDARIEVRQLYWPKRKICKAFVGVIYCFISPLNPIFVFGLRDTVNWVKKYSNCSVLKESSRHMI
jgi:hypothetical protein